LARHQIGRGYDTFSSPVGVLFPRFSTLWRSRSPILKRDARATNHKHSPFGKWLSHAVVECKKLIVG